MNPKLIWIGAMLIALAQAPTDDGGIEGVVLSALTDEPLSFADLTVDFGERQHTFVSGADGRFRITGLPAGPHRIIVEKTGYAPARPAARKTPGAPGFLFTLNSGEQLKGVLLRMAPPAAITGMVVDIHGQPVQRASVRAGPRFAFEEDTADAFLRTAATDDRGAFRLYCLEAGEYLLQVEGPRRGLVARESDSFSLGTAYYPATADLSKALAVTIRAGEERRLESITLPEIRNVLLRVQIVDGEVPQVMQFLIDDRAQTEYRRYTLTPVLDGAKNAVSVKLTDVIPIRVAASTAHRIGMVAKTPEGVVFGERVVEIGTTDQQIEIALHSGARLKGRATAQGGDRKPLDWSKVRVKLTGLYGGRAVKDFNSLDCRVNSDGTFTIESVPDGEYQIRIDGLPPDSFVARMRQNDAELRSDRLLVAGPTQFDIDIRTDGAAVQGVVRDADGAAVSGAFVALVPDAPQGDNPFLYRTVESNPDGRFSIRGAAPGRYQLFAWFDHPGGAYRNDAFLARFKDQARTLNLVSGQTETMDARIVADSHEER